MSHHDHPHHHHHHHHHDGRHQHTHDAAGPHGRGHRGPGHGPGPGGPGGRGGRGGFDDDSGMPRGRKLSSDDLQLLLLALIADQPSHGYELIKALEQRSNGYYVPSPGMMYPALACMEDRGHVSIALEGNRKRYALSDEGRAHLDANREGVDLMLAKLDRAAEKMALMRNALASAETGEAGESPRDSDEFHAARHALRHALHARAGASAEEQARIAAILTRAVAEIESQGGDAGPASHAPVQA